MENTLRFIQNRFKEYYRGLEPLLPDRFTRREFGFMFFDKDFMLRHTSFKSRSALKNFLSQNSPAHVYYSSAYYEIPDAKKMSDKNWLGSDLIFDLDADHIKGSKDMSYEEMLERVKSEVIKMLNTFILRDFNFNEKDVKVVFSGGRGYHIHVTDPRVFSLNSHERREIVDYITANDLDTSIVLYKEPYSSRRYRRRTTVKERIRMAKPTDKGWRGKISKGTLDFFDNLDRLIKEGRRDEAVAMLAKSSGISRRKSSEFITDIFEKEYDGRRRYERLKRGEVDLLQKFPERFWSSIIESQAVRLIGETDEPVTTDIRRLIRLPSSLHGKTALRVVPLSIEELKDFQPLRDAVSFPDDAVKVRITRPAKITLQGESFNLKEGEAELPEFVALFLMCRGNALLME